jgi:peptide/nickel transport system ATP-binding protein
MALINDPKLLVADEPTTALDVTVQAQILELIERLQKETNAAVIMITHDLGVVAEVTDEIAVMYAGRVIERASTDAIFDAPQHPYTWGLLRSSRSRAGPRRSSTARAAARSIRAARSCARPTSASTPTSCRSRAIRTTSWRAC